MGTQGTVFYQFIAGRYFTTQQPAEPIFRGHKTYDTTALQQYHINSNNLACTTCWGRKGLHLLLVHYYSVCLILLYRIFSASQFVSIYLGRGVQHGETIDLGAGCGWVQRAVYNVKNTRNKHT